MDALGVDIQEAARVYLNFLDDGDNENKYHTEVTEMVRREETRLIVDIADLRRHDMERAERLLNGAFSEIIAFEKAIKEYVNQVDPQFGKLHDEFYMGLEGSFGKKHVTPRTLKASFMNSTVCVEGIITKASLVRPKLVQSIHYCPASKKMLSRQYGDLTSISEKGQTGSAYPTQDPETGEALETEYGLCTFRDHQTVTVQEMPEKAPTGQLPRAVDVVIDNDLVDQVKPGDRCQIIGTFRCLPGKKAGHTTGIFRTAIIANNIKMLSKDKEIVFSDNDVSMIRRFSKTPNVFTKIAKSMAPSIHGHLYSKKALLAMLLGGNEKILKNKTRLRGDINVMFIGDPSTAKSQLLRYVLKTAPRAINTTGRGTSGVGLTAAVTTDDETGERRLEAGAMVLADRGVVCIDEFDKMTEIDRTAIHEVMEQGRVTIAKAGIQAKLNARCSVLAAANPIFGRYNQYKTPMENIAMPDSLLSRFDLLFVIIDTAEPELDREIADRVIKNHRYRDPSQQDGEAIQIDNDADRLTTNEENSARNQAAESMYEDHNEFLHGSRRSSERILSSFFIRKYIQCAKALRPTLTKEAADLISEEYARLRSVADVSEGNAKTIPITARALETLIRLSTAHAKCRMAKKIDKKDAQAAIELIQFAYFAKVAEKPKKNRGMREDDGTEEEDNNEELTEDEEELEPVKEDEDSQDALNASVHDMSINAEKASPKKTPKKGRKGKRGRTSESSARTPKRSKAGTSQDDPFDPNNDEDAPEISIADSILQAPIKPVSDARREQFQERLNEAFYSGRDQVLKFFFSK
ncbi:unnamed protein product [Oikopleura dioica]|uniref:DNA replication licensing factor MCM3 n=1 Tax=Oikopleura dioica TaxID=34765 RepID=E4XDP1_OIKDI|nr:unnamed protein product [Oikopleura dioica]